MKSFARRMLLLLGLLALVLITSIHSPRAQAAAVVHPTEHIGAVPNTVGPTLNIDDVSHDEGNASTTSYQFTVSLTEAAGPGGVTFDITTQNDSATTANNDYQLQSLTGQTIPEGSSTYPFTVLVNGDATPETNERFFVQVSAVTGATEGDLQGEGVIQNDDHLIVNTTDDDDDGVCNASLGDCTLREAINAANALVGADTITFNILDSVCALLGQDTTNENCSASEAIDTANVLSNTDALTIPSINTCSSANVCTIELASALPTINENLNIDGSANSADITVSGADAFPVLFANGGAPLTVIALTIVDGYTTFHGAGIYAGDALTMTNVLVENSTSEQTAGGVAAEGPVVMTGSTLAGNTANNGGGGGAVFLSTANVSNSTFRNNKTDSASHAGGAYFTGAATLGNVTFDSNLAGLAGGGGAVFENTANLTGGAFKNNLASFAGGGAYFNSTATIDATTFFSNSVLVNRGGGAYFNGAATVQNALFNGNSAQADRGGGAYFRQDAQITATSFVTNTASNRAGGAYLNATGTLTNTNFYTNTATVRGGGVYLGGAASVLGGVIQGNLCTNVCVGGGAFVASTLVLTDTQFIDNVTDGDGGGASTSANTTMTTALFDGNRSISVIALSGQSASIVGSTGGGLLHSAGVLNVAGSTFIDNHASSIGGGISNINTATANVTNSSFSANTSGSGGGIINAGGATLNVTNSTFDGNQALASGDGGGINSLGIANVTNSTFSGNSAGRAGGGIANTGTMTVTNSTVAGNSAANGGGIANNPDPSSPSTTLDNTIVADSASGGDCYVPTGTLAVDAYNLDSDGSCDNATQKTVAEINLGPLAPNGGPTQTMALSPESAAIDKAPSASCTAAPVNGLDQRGQPRNFDGNGAASTDECDIGAYESQTTSGVPRIVVQKSTRPENDTTLFQFKLRGPAGRTFSIADDQNHSSGVLPVGVYTLEEVLPPGWDTATPFSQMTCDDGSPINAINLAADEVIVCRFLNYKKGNVIVKKVTLPAAAAPSFAMRLINNTTNVKTLFSLANSQQFNTGAISSVPTYKLLETLPGGWRKKSMTCDNGSPSTAIVIPPGGTVTCTVTNENTIPSNITLSNSSVAENKPAGTLVGNLTATDPVAGDTFSFSFVNDGTSAASSNSRFQIVGSQLKTGQSFDFESKTSHNIKLKVTDSVGQTKIKAFVISIINGPN